jgi:hypothetical protein
MLEMANEAASGASQPSFLSFDLHQTLLASLHHPWILLASSSCTFSSLLAREVCLGEDVFEAGRPCSWPGLGLLVLLVLEARFS